MNCVEVLEYGYIQGQILSHSICLRWIHDLADCA
jgi:hypothetical protein